MLYEEKKEQIKDAQRLIIQGRIGCCENSKRGGAGGPLFYLTSFPKKTVSYPLIPLCASMEQFRLG